MRRVKLTDAAVVALSMSACKSVAFYFDSTLIGFGVRLRRRSDGKVRGSWVAQWHRAGCNRRVTLGNAANVGADRARELAAEVIGRIPPPVRVNHGHSSSLVHRIWRQMRQRCRNPNNARFASYGGRGISVDPRWDSFPQFLSDVGEKPSPQHSLDRINVNGNYEPGNVRWATAAQQMANRRPRQGCGHGGGLETIEWL
jgi:hypothetical protein